MATTTNYGWTTPDDTALVKNGASAIRTLGSSIDTSLGGDWTAYTPTWTNLSPGNGTTDFAYKQLSKTVLVRGLFTRGSTSTITGAVSISLPVTSKSFTAGFVLGIANFDDVGVNGYSGVVRWESTTSASLRAFNAAGTYVVNSSISSTVPFTWATGDLLAVEFFYEAA